MTNKQKLKRYYKPVDKSQDAYVFDCGCTYYANSVERITQKRLACPEHGDILIWSTRVCPDCNHVFIMKPGKMKKLCTPCRNVRRYVYNWFYHRDAFKIKSTDGRCDGYTQLEVGRFFGVSHQMIQQIERKALAKFRARFDIMYGAPCF